MDHLVKISSVIDKVVDSIISNSSSDQDSNSNSYDDRTTVPEDVQTSAEEDIDKVDVNLLSNILECHLEEGPANVQWSDKSHGWEEKNSRSKSKTDLACRFPYPISPRKVYSMLDGKCHASPEKLLEKVKITPTFILPESQSLKRDCRNDGSLLDELFTKLKHERFVEHSISWLISKKIILAPFSCRRHAGYMHYDTFKIHWHCSNCALDTIVTLPSFFNLLKEYKVSDILVIVLHWACQSNIHCITEDTNLGVEDIWKIWTEIQKSCALSMRKLSNQCRLKSTYAPYLTSQKNHVIEAAVFRFGNNLIIGALDRLTRFSQIKVISFSYYASNDLGRFLESIVNTFNFPFRFVSDFIFFQPVVEKLHLGSFYLPDPGITDPSNDGLHNLNVVNYVRKVLVPSFREFSSRTVSCRTLQLYLDELQWRERYGHNALQTFWNMLYLISGQEVGKPATAVGTSDDELSNGCTESFDSADLPEWIVDELPPPDIYSNEEIDKVIPDAPLSPLVVFESQKNENSDNVNKFENIIISGEKPFTFKIEKQVPSQILEQLLQTWNHAGSETADGKSSTSSTDNSSHGTSEKEENCNEVNHAELSEQKTGGDRVEDEDVRTMVSESASAVDLAGSGSPQMLKSLLLSDPRTIIDPCETVELSDPSSSAGLTMDVTMSGSFLVNGDMSAVDSEYWSDEDIALNVDHILEGTLRLTINDLLSMKTWPLLLTLKGCLMRQEIDAERDLETFRKRLVQQGYFTKPIQWMVDHHLVHEHSTCEICSNNQFYLTVDQPSTDRTDKYCWICTNPECATKKPFRRLKFFTLFGFSICEILHLIYHWSAQSDVDDVKHKVIITEYKIRYVYWAIQKLMSKTLAVEKPMLGDKGFSVEVGIVQYGSYCIIGALERNSLLTRLIALNAPAVYTAAFIEEVISEWLVPSTVVFTMMRCYNFHDGKLVQMYEQQPEVLSSSQAVKCYLHNLVNTMFARFSTTLLKLDMIQSFLDELQWRERYGMVPESAFWNLFYQIAQDDRIDISRRVREQNDSGLQISEVRIVSADFFAESQASPSEHEETTTELKSNNDEPEIFIDDSCAEEAMVENDAPDTAPSTPTPSFPADSTLELICEEEESPSPVHPSSASDAGKPADISGITILSEKDLELDLDDDRTIELECISHDVEVTSPEHAEQDEDPPLVVECTLPSEEDVLWDNRCLTIGWKGLKLLRPSFSDCMTFFGVSKKRENVSEKNESSEKYYCLDEYYFARKKSIMSSSSSNEMDYVFCCTVCKMYIHSNVEVMSHSLVHATEKRHEEAKRSWKLVNCPFCYTQSFSKRDMDTHVNEVHERESSLSCYICSQVFQSSSEFTEHMKKQHVSSEMPFSCSICHFRSSLHCEVLDHFKDVHNNEPHLMCPFCLKVCSPRAKTDAVLFTQTYCYHLINHQQVKNTSKCPKCSLSFLTPIEVSTHLAKDHLSFQNQKGVVPFKPRLSPVILVSFDDFPETTSVPPIQPVLPQTTDKDTPIMTRSCELRMKEVAASEARVAPSPVEIVSQSVSIATNRVSSPFHRRNSIPILPKPAPVQSSPPVFPVPSTSSSGQSLQKSLKRPPSESRDSESLAKKFKLMEDTTPSLTFYSERTLHCLECGSRIKKKHFFKRLNCNCMYSTHCGKAFVHHMIQEHATMGKKLQRKKRKLMLRTQLQKSCLCSCGFASADGDKLALHLMQCDGQITIPEMDSSTKVVSEPVIQNFAENTESLSPAPTEPLIPEKSDNVIQLNEIMQPHRVTSLPPQYPIQMMLKDQELQKTALMQQHQQQVEYVRQQWVGQPAMTGVPLVHPNFIMPPNSATPAPYVPAPPFPPNRILIQEYVQSNPYANCDNFVMPTNYSTISTEYLPVGNVVNYAKTPSFDPITQRFDYRLPQTMSVGSSLDAMRQVARFAPLGVAGGQAMLRPPINPMHPRSVLLNNARLPNQFVNPQPVLCVNQSESSCNSSHAVKREPRDL